MQHMKHIGFLNASLNVFATATPCRQESERLPFVGDLEPITALQQGILTASLGLNIVRPICTLGCLSTAAQKKTASALNAWYICYYGKVMAKYMPK